MTRLRRGSPALIRELNRAAVLALIGSQGPIARAEIARRLSLSAATVTEITRHLLAEGLVEVVDQAPSNGGRPGLLLGLVAEAAHALGVKIAADHLAIVRVNLDGEVLDRADDPFDSTAPDAATRLATHLRDVIERGPRTRLLGVGIGVAGIADARGVVDAPILGWRNVPLGPALRAELGLPVLIDNDVNTLAVAERLYGRGRDVEHFLNLTIGRGVGLGIVVGGELYRGAGGGAGEFGHVTVDPAGPECTCGKRGCLETFVSDPALVRQAVRTGLVPSDTTVHDGIQRLRALADAGHPAARRIYAEAGAVLGRAVAWLINVLNPQLILVSGEGTAAWPHLARTFEAEVAAGTFELLRGVPIEIDPWDDAKWARGAAALVLRATFSVPLYERQIEESVRARLGGGRNEDVAMDGTSDRRRAAPISVAGAER
jgi:predicted NBD/HSP70 family sugar kinase